MNTILEQINSAGFVFVEFTLPMLVQASVLIVVLLLADLLLRKKVRAVFRYWLWMLVVIKLVLPTTLYSPVSLGSWFGNELTRIKVSESAFVEDSKGKYKIELPARPELSTGLDASGNEIRNAEWPRLFAEVDVDQPLIKGGATPAEPPTPLTWKGIVFLVWAAVVAAMGLLLLQRAIFVSGLVAQAKNPTELMNDAFRFCCGQMGLKGKVGLKVSANAASPAVCGLFRPVILLPQNLAPALGSSHLRPVLLHELAHISRGDLWVNLAQTILQIIYFYNPLLWLANSIIRRIREQAVDEAVQVAMGANAPQYPQTLVDVAKMAFSRPALSLRLIGVVESKSALKGRIKKMLNQPIPKTAKLGILGLIAVLIFAAILLPMADRTGEQVNSSPWDSLRRAGEIEKPAGQEGTENPKSDVEMLSASVKVTDEDGKPVEGAEITIDGLRNNSGHYGWDSNRFGQAPHVSTDAEGIAKVSYPKYIIEKSKPEEISFKVNHPEYCPVRPYNYRVDGQSPPIVLRKGATVKLSAYIGSKDNVITNIVPQVSGTEVMLDSSYWKQDNDGQLTTSQIPPGPHYLRAVYFPKDESIHFSDTVFFEARKGETFQFELELKPGLRLEGKLDSYVPRLIQNGRIVVRACQEEEKNENRPPLWWQTHRNIKDDGTFVIESLPPGMVEVIAICDGFISKNPSGDEKNVILHTGKPQIFELKSDKNEVEIMMEPTASCEVTVRDEKGKPIRGAQVVFSPNVQWGGRTSQIFAQRLFNSEEFIRSGSKFDYKKQLEKYKTDAFAATTDEKGIAIVRNLPGYSQDFAVVHSDYELPIKTNYGYGRREARAELSVGKTSTVTVTMQKKGKEFLTVSDRENKRQVNLCKPQIDPSREDMQILTGQKSEQGTLSGKVVDEKGNPLEKVLVDVYTWYKGNETYTDANGYFYIGGFEPEQKTVEIRFSRENFTPKYLIRQPLGIKDTVVVLNDKTYFEGIVTGSDGKPVPNAEIKAAAGTKDCEGVQIGEVPTECKSDKNGFYKLYVQADIYDIQVKAEQGVVRLSNIKIDKNESKKLDLKLDNAVTFLAKVIDSQTKEPVSGVRLFHWQHPGVEGVSDFNGIIRISNMLPGKFEFWAESKEYCRWWSEDCLSEWNRYKIDDEKTGWQRNFDFLDFDLKDQMQPVTITVEKGVKITGKVIDPVGNPVAGATATLAKTGSGNSITGDTRYSFTTDANGNFEMMMPASKKAKYNLVAHDGKYEQWRNWANGVLEPIQTNPGDVIEDVIIKLMKPAVVKGTVVDSLGNPVPNRQVRASAFDKLENRYYDPSVRTDTNGNFEIKFIRPGKQYIQAYPFWLSAEQAPEGTSQIVTVEAGQVLDGIKLVAERAGENLQKPAGQDVNKTGEQVNSGQQPSVEDSRNLLMERRDILQKTLQTVEWQCNAGRADSKQLQQAKIDLLWVESELSGTPQKRIDILEQIVTLYLEQEKTTKLLLDAGRITQDELNKLKLLRLNAEEELARAKADLEKAKSEKTSIQPDVEKTSQISSPPEQRNPAISVYPPSGSKMALFSELQVVFDQPMMPEEFKIVDASLEEKFEDFSDVAAVRSYVVYDADKYQFSIPLILPCNWNGPVQLGGFKTAKGVEVEPIVLNYTTSRDKFSDDLLQRFEKAKQSRELRALLENVKNARSRLKSLSQTVYTAYDFGDHKESHQATFKMQGSKQFYVDMSEEFEKPWHIGSDGEKCWFYNEHMDANKLVAIDFNQIAEKKISICNPLGIAESDIDTVIKQNNAEYLGTEMLDGRKCHIVRSWLVKIEHKAACSIIKWWFDSETYMPAKVVSDSGRWRVSHRFIYDKVNEPINDSEFRPGFVTKIEPQEPEPLDEDYNTRYIYIIDGSSSGRMSINWGKRGPKGTSGSGLN